MPYQSLGEFIQAADVAGEVRHVEGANLELDVGCLTELMAERNGPMLVFDKFSGYPAGHRVCANAIRSARRFSLALDLPLDIHPLELLSRWREKRKKAASVPATVVKDGPILECVQKGDDVDLEDFPPRAGTRATAGATSAPPTWSSPATPSRAGLTWAFTAAWSKPATALVCGLIP